MNIKFRYLFLFLLTAVFSLLPICFAAPKVVMAEVTWQYVEEGVYEKGKILMIGISIN